VSKERFTTAEGKIEKKKKSKNAGDTDEEDSEDTSCIYVLTHPGKCGFSAQTVSYGYRKNALMALPAVFA
jgi:hypothetical protein